MYRLAWNTDMCPWVGCGCHRRPYRISLLVSPDLPCFISSHLLLTLYMFHYCSDISACRNIKLAQMAQWDSCVWFILSKMKVYGDSTVHIKKPWSQICGGNDTLQTRWKQLLPLPSWAVVMRSALPVLQNFGAAEERQPHYILNKYSAAWHKWLVKVSWIWTGLFHVSLQKCLPKVGMYCNIAQCWDMLMLCYLVETAVFPSAVSVESFLKLHSSPPLQMFLNLTLRQTLKFIRNCQPV